LLSGYNFNSKEKSKRRYYQEIGKAWGTIIEGYTEKDTYYNLYIIYSVIKIRGKQYYQMGYFSYQNCAGHWHYRRCNRAPFSVENIAKITLNMKAYQRIPKIMSVQEKIKQSLLIREGIFANSDDLVQEDESELDFPKTETDRICNNLKNKASKWRSFFTTAISAKVAMVIRIWVFPAFSLVPMKRLMRGWQTRLDHALKEWLRAHRQA
jgi:hypothetical protein